MIEPERMNALLAELAAVLESRHLDYELVAIGGGSLQLIGLLIRPTFDLDVIASVDNGTYTRLDRLDAPLANAVRDVAVRNGIAEDWLNTQPADVMNPPGLPDGFAARSVRRDFGALTLHLASRLDQICFKLHAAVDRAPASKHLDDLRLLEPDRAELLFAARWSMGHDPSGGYRWQCLTLLKILGVDDAEHSL